MDRQSSSNNLAIVAVNHDENIPATVVSSTTTSSGGYGLSSMIMPTAAPLTATPDSVIDITDDTVKHEKEDDDIEHITGRLVHFLLVLLFLFTNC